MGKQESLPEQPESSQLVSGEWREQKGKAVWVRTPTKINERRKARMQVYTREEVAQHNKPDDLWIIIDGKVYDISTFAMTHPGGHLCLENMAGGDATDPFQNYHPAYVYKRSLPRFQIGTVTDGYSSEFVQEWRLLRQRLLAEGKYETSASYYIIQSLWLLLLFAMSVYLAIVEQGMTSTVLAGVFLGAFWQQAVFTAHDLGHNGVTHVRVVDSVLGILLANVMGGVSLGWWKWSHNVHHVITNSVEHDPDIQHLPVMAVTPKIFKTFISSFHHKEMVFDGLARSLVRYQHILYYPMMALARFNLYIQSWVLLFSKEKWHFKWLEAPCLIIFASWYCGVMYQLPNWNQRIAYLCLSHVVSGILHVQITLSHFSMDTYFGRPKFSDDQDNWFKMQLATSQDIESSWYNEWFHGGLQYQVEHHLFPRLPRQNLPYARKLVIEFARKHNVPHMSPGFVQGNVDIIASLKAAADRVEEYESGKAAFFDSMLWEGMNARG